MVRIKPESAAGQFLISQDVPEDVLNSTRFRALDWQAGDALTVVWPTRNATVFIKSRFLETDESGDLPVGRNLPLIRHELHHVHQGKQWGFIGYWARHLWARVRHFSLMAKDSSVEAPAYGLQREAHVALDELERSSDPIDMLDRAS